MREALLETIKLLMDIAEPVTLRAEKVPIDNWCYTLQSDVGSSENQGILAVEICSIGIDSDDLCVVGTGGLVLRAAKWTWNVADELLYAGEKEETESNESEKMSHFLLNSKRLYYAWADYRKLISTAINTINKSE